MKKFNAFLPLLFVFLMRNQISYAQPVWHNTIGFPNDSASQVTAVKVLADNTDQIYVLTYYQKNTGVSASDKKILLKKYDENGGLIWTYIYDNLGNNDVRCFDMCLDGLNNIYIAGGVMNSPYQVMLLKVTAAGAFDWVQFGNSAFNADWYTEITFRNNLFYVRGNAGVAVYDQSGNEQYAIAEYNNAFDVDYSGRIVMTVYASGYNLVRYTNAGLVDFTDSTLQADKILCDYNNEIYLASGLQGMQHYELAKHNANGQYQWSLSGLPVTPAFGDFSYGLMETGQNEFVLFGVSDTIIKFNQQGQILWKKNMGGMDDYIISGKILGNGFILLTGTLNGFAGSDVNTKIFNTNGTEIWGQLYGAVFAGSEYGVDVDVSTTGIYVTSQLLDSANIMKYMNPAGGTNIDFEQVCVDSVWIDSSGMVHITVFNGNFTHMNYPAVSIVSPAGDTVSTGIINFFAQLGNTYQEYVNSINDTSITDFSNYTFVMHNTFNPDSMAAIAFCIPTSVSTRNENISSIFPNPVNDKLTVQFSNELERGELLVYDIFGKVWLSEKNLKQTHEISCNELPAGVYVLKSITEKGAQFYKFIVTH